MTRKEFITLIESLGFDIEEEQNDIIYYKHKYYSDVVIDLQYDNYVYIRNLTDVNHNYDTDTSIDGYIQTFNKADFINHSLFKPIIQYNREEKLKDILENDKK